VLGLRLASARLPIKKRMPAMLRNPIAAARPDALRTVCREGRVKICKFLTIRCQERNELPRSKLRGITGAITLL
jgi:hypothetical protein